MNSSGDLISLDLVEPGESGVIQELRFPEEEKLMFIELGFLPGETVRLVRRSPWGDPLEVEVMGVRQGIRASDAAAIQVLKNKESR